MRNNSAFRIILIAIVLPLLLLWGGEVCAQSPPDMRGISPQPSPSSTMAISPDSKYLYLFHSNRIYQFELPALRLIKSIEVEIPDRPMPRGSSKGDLIKDLDKDMDGRVSRKEFTGPGQVFDKLDRNNDGYIDKGEARK